MKIDELVEAVIELEISQDRTYPNNLGGRAIDKIYGKELSLKEWTAFHSLYRTMAPETLTGANFNDPDFDKNHETFFNNISH